MSKRKHENYSVCAPFCRDETRDEPVSKPQPKGRCEGCGNSPRVLTQIVSGQQVCQTCLREIRGPKRPNHLAPLDKIEELRSEGHQVSDDLTKEEYRRIKQAEIDSAEENIQELAEIYRSYAKLKGWSTDKRLIRDKVLAWLDQGIGAVGLAIEFSETGVDGAKHLGYDAEARTADPLRRIQHVVERIAGVEYPNEDGTDRRQIIMRCERLEQLLMLHESDNAYDTNAIKICRSTGEQLGYMPRKLASKTISRVRQGYEHAAIFLGNDPNSCDARFVLVIAKPGVTNEEVQKYCERRIVPLNRNSGYMKSGTDTET